MFSAGLIQLKPILPSQSVASSSTTGVLAGSSSVTVSNVGATTGGKLLITQPAQQTGKVIQHLYCVPLICNSHRAASEKSRWLESIRP